MRKTKLFILLTFLLSIGLNSWADNTYEYYYNGTTTINTSDFFDGTSFSTNAYAASLTFTTSAGTVTASKVSKMNSSGYVDFTTTAKSTVTIVMMSKAKTASGKANTVKLDSNTSADFGSTETEVVISDPIVFENVVAGEHRITRGGQECGLVYVKVVQEAMTAPAITTQPEVCSVLALNGTTTLSIVATPSSGSCNYNWYACNSEGVTSGESLGTTASYDVPTSATASAATLYYCCVVGDGGANTTKSNVAKIYVLDRAAKQTWDFTTISEEDIKYNENFWTSNNSGVYNHIVAKATDGILQDNFGNDLLNGIRVRREEGDATVYVYCGNSRYGINLQGTESKPGIWKIPVVSGKFYKVTYTSKENGKTLGYAIESGATHISGDLTASITTAFTNTASFIVEASATTMVLKNKGGDDGNSCTIVKIEDITPSGKISACGWSTFASSHPLDLSTISGGTAYYASAASGGTVTLTPTGDVSVPAGEGIMVKGTPNAIFTINVAASGTAIEGNLLKGQTTTGNVAASTAGTYHYVFGFVTETPTTFGFYNLASNTEIAAGKAYLETSEALTPAVGAPAIIRIVDEESGATNIEAFDASEEAVKFIENGKLYIKKNGVVYDMMGTVVR